MSLIIDALKKAQQLRSKETKGAPFFRPPSPATGDRKKWPWILSSSILIFLILLCVIWILFGIPPSPPSEPGIKIAERPVLPEHHEVTSPEVQMEEKGIEPIEKIPFQKPSVQASIPVEEPKVKVIQPSLYQEEKPEMLTQPIEKIETQPKKEQMASAEEKAPSPPAPKGEVLSKPVTVIQGNGRDLALKAELIQHFNAGVSYGQRGEVSRAIQSYQKVIEMDPNYIEAFNNLGLLYQEMGDLENALKFYQKAIEIHPHYEKALNNIGIVHLLRGEDEEALARFHNILSFNANHLESHIHLGTLYKKKGFIEKGIDFYQKALKIDPQHGIAHYHLGLLFEETKNRERAIEHYQQFIQLSSSSYPELVSKVRRHLRQLMATQEKSSPAK